MRRQAIGAAAVLAAVGWALADPGAEVRHHAWPDIHVWNTAFSPDGRRYAAGGDANAARVWDLDSGKLVHELHGHTAWIEAVTFVGGGHRLLTAGADGTVRLWDVDAGREIRRFEGHRGAVRAVAPAPDGKTLATGGQDRTIRLWDRETARELRQLQGHPGDGAVAFAPNGDQLLSWGGDKGLRLWDVAAAKVVRTFQGHAAAVYNAGFLADGRIYSYSAGDRTLRLWDAATGAETLRVAVGGDATDRNVAVSPDGRYFLSSHTDRTVRWRSAPSGQELGRFTVAADKAVGLSLAPDARHAVGGSFRGFIYLWRLPEAPAVAVRKTWRFDNGFYENTRGNEWFTRAAGATYAYKEVARNDEFIELYDDTRKVGIRIYKDHLDIKNPGKAKWEFLHKGKWD